MSKKVDTVRLLVEHGADVITLDKTHSTALHLAAFFGSPEMVRLLLEHGADVSMLDENKKTPLHLALSPVSTHFGPKMHGVHENIQVWPH